MLTYLRTRYEFDVLDRGFRVFSPCVACSRSFFSSGLTFRFEPTHSYSSIVQLVTVFYLLPAAGALRPAATYCYVLRYAFTIIFQ